MKRFVVLALIAAAVVAAPPVARAAAPPSDSVTLAASPRIVTYGQVVHFSGEVAPRSAGQPVSIVDENGEMLAHAVTRANGTYRVDSRPSSNAVVHARWGVVSSKKLQVKVRPILHARRSPVRVFDTTVARGRVVPPDPGGKVTITVLRDGKVADRFSSRISKKGRFTERFTIERPGRHVVVVRYANPDMLAATWRSNPATTPLPQLHEGSTGTFVKLMERRLAELHYRVYAQDGKFDYHDTDSVMAFHKVQGMARTEVVDQATWYALATPKIPAPRNHVERPHFEVDLTKQVVYYVRHGKIAAIIHASTGKPSTPTRPGHFYVTQKVPGFNQKQMYYSSFFDGNRALHGYVEVPPYAASHGCVRLPYWHAIWVYNRAPYGTPVWVYF